jgi:NAD(P)-dependent dehydrogenase (short-subunit alcohol dehydrogenase family)
MIAIDLAGKTALITGASQGLGATTARTLAAAGANVIINYFDDAAGHNCALATALATELGNDKAIALPADVRDPVQIEAMLTAASQKFSTLDIVVNNAAILRDKTLKNMSSDDWQSVIDTNLTGVFNVCKAVTPRLSEGGRIVSIASIAASVGFFGQANYAAAKAGVGAMTRVLSRELAKRKITVNAVAPGVVLTEMGKSIPQTARDQMLINIPLARFGEPTEIASVILFLCSDLASYVTGQTLHVNGGWWG